MSLRSALGRVRGHGSAKSGVRGWWMLRLTAIALVPLTLWFIYSMVTVGAAGHGAVVAWVRTPGTAMALVLLVAAMFTHLTLGLTEVIEDYVHGEATKVASLIVLKLAAILLAASGVFAVFNIAYGG
jgi:succinate dehydrogenase / fumarate reductase membrane anchor subunit